VKDGSDDEDEEKLELILFFYAYGPNIFLDMNWYL